MGIGSIAFRFLGKTTSYSLSVVSAVKTAYVLTDKDKYTRQARDATTILKEWHKAVELIGRKPYKLDEICEIKTGTAIDDLGKKELFFYTDKGLTGLNPIPNREYHLGSSNKRKQRGYGYYNTLEEQISKTENPIIEEPKPLVAKKYIKTAINHLESVSEQEFLPEIKQEKKIILNTLQQVYTKLDNKQDQNNSYTRIQNQLNIISEKMQGIESKIEQQIKKFKSKRNKRIAKNAAISLTTAFIGDLIPGKKK